MNNLTVQATFAGQGKIIRKRKTVVKELQKSHISSLCSLLDLLIRLYSFWGFYCIGKIQCFHISQKSNLGNHKMLRAVLP